MQRIISCLAALMLIFTSLVSVRATAAVEISGNTVKISDIPENATVITAYYKNGALNSVKSEKGGNEITATIDTADADVVKLFVWDMKTIKPMCDAIEIKATVTPIEAPKQSSVYIHVNGTVFEAKLADNSSAEAFAELLKDGDLEIEMSDYGDFEKVGTLPKSLPRNDEEITTSAGDLILYQGNSITLYYDTNTWNFTRLGKVEGVTTEELLAVLGEGSVTMRFSLTK